MNKNKLMAPPKAIRPKTSTSRPSTATEPGTSRKALPSKEKLITRAKINKNATIIGDLDTTIYKSEVLSEFDGIHRQIAYGKFIRAMLEDCLVEEKIEHEENEIDIQMALLADRFKKTSDQLDKTSKRLKDIHFVVEQQRLLNLKSQDCSHFYDIIDNSQVEDKLNNLKLTEETCLNKLETKNVDFGYDKETGHKQLLDAVNDALEGLEEIKKHSNLDVNKFQEYEKMGRSIGEVEKDRFEVASLKSKFETKFPLFNEKLLKEVSEKIASVMDED